MYITGSVWVFGNYDEAMDGCGGSSDCCDKQLMKFALGVIILDWVFIGIIVVVGVCVCCCVCCCVACAKRNDEGTNTV